MEGGDEDEMVLPDTQPDTQPEPETATQPFEADEPVGLKPQPDLSASHRTTEDSDSFHSARESVRARGETAEPMNLDPTPTQERTVRPPDATRKELKPELDTTPNVKPQSKSKPQLKSNISQGKPPAQEKTREQYHEDTISSVQPKNVKSAAAHPQEDDQDVEMEMENTTKEDTILDDNFDDIGSPSDGSTPERLPVRKSSLSFASLPAREPLTKKSMGGARISRTSHIDLAKLSHKRNSNYLGTQTGGHKSAQPSSEDDAGDSAAMDFDHEKKPEDEIDMDQASKLHNKKSTQSLHDRISMLGKPQTRPNKSNPAVAGLSAGQIAYPELPGAKTAPKPDSSSQKTMKTPAPETDADDDDWIKPPGSSQRPNLTKSKTTDVMETLFDTEKDPYAGGKNISTTKKPSQEPERPKSSASIFSSPRPRGHQQSASTSILAPQTSTTPTGSPRRFEGPLSASKIRLQSIMKSAKGLFTSTGSPSRVQNSSPEPARVQQQERMSVDISDQDDVQMSAPRHISSPPRQEGRRTRSSTEKEEKRHRKEQEDRQREEEAQLEEARQEEARLEKAREQEKQRAAQLKATQDKSSIEPEERTAQKPSQPQRQQSREPESTHGGSKYGIPQPKQTDRRPKPPTREPAQKPEPRPVSIRVGSAMSSRQIPVASSVSSSVHETNASAPAPAPAPAPMPKQASLKKKGSNQSLQTASSASSLKSSTSSQTQAQRKAQLASERKREQDRKRAAQQQQDESRRQEMQSRAESRAELDRGKRELSAQEESNKAAIERRRQENARRHGRQGSQQIVNEVLYSVPWLSRFPLITFRVPCYNTKKHPCILLRKMTREERGRSLVRAQCSIMVELIHLTITLPDRPNDP